MTTLSNETPTCPARRARPGVRVLALRVLIGVLVCGATPSLRGEDGVREDEDVVARVDGRAITGATVAAVMDGISRSGGEGDRDAVIEELIDMEVLRAAALRERLDERASVAAEIDLEATRVLANAWLAEESSRTVVGDDELREAYDDEVVGLTPEEYSASHILLESAAQAREVLGQLERGSGWDEVAEARSIDASAQGGGALGWFSMLSMERVIVDAVVDLEVGEIARSPVRTNFGFHVIRLDGRRPGAGPDFSSVRSVLQDKVLRARIAARIDSMRRAADIERMPDADL